MRLLKACSYVSMEPELSRSRGKSARRIHPIKEEEEQEEDEESQDEEE